ncbi:MAG TPA: TIM barrel protein [Bryobacteraceae bacterium]|jgi:sugar phosphate isomerase/epimerase|nr:TIM barrel protein [Bryobacteraceae bacterium]
MAAIRLGYDSYSVRALKWNALQHLDFAARHQLDAIQFSGLESYESLEPADLEKVKRRAGELGLRIDAGIGCICELSKSWNPSSGSARLVLEEGLNVAHAVGATVMRCFMGTQKDRYGDKPLDQLMERTVQNFRSVRSKALDLGVTIAIENHKDMQAEQMKQLIEESGTDFTGANLDVGNPLYLMEHPLTTIETLGPYTVTAHFRDTAVYEVPRGAAAQWTALGDGAVDMKELIAKFDQLCPRSSLHLEIITGRPPEILPYLEPDFWKTFQNMPARDFARFVALAKKGQPFTGHMVIEDYEGQPPAPEFKAALEYQQLHDLERSFEYAKQVLHIGLHSA